MRTKLILTAIALALITSTSIAQMFGPSYGFPPDDNIWQRGITKLYDELKLTDDQKSKLEKLFFEHRKNQADLLGKLNKAKIELQELLSAEKLDKSAIDKKIDEISNYTRELTKNRANYWMSVQQVLTPEQRKILKDKVGYFGFMKGFRGWAKPEKRLRLHRW